MDMDFVYLFHAILHRWKAQASDVKTGTEHLEAPSVQSRQSGCAETQAVSYQGRQSPENRVSVGSSTTRLTACQYHKLQIIWVCIPAFQRCGQVLGVVVSCDYGSGRNGCSPSESIHGIQCQERGRKCRYRNEVAPSLVFL